MALRVNVECHLVVGDSFVRKLPDEVTGDGSAELPAEFCGQRAGVVEERVAGDCRRVVEILLAFREGLTDIVAQLVLHGISPQNKGAAEIRFPLLEYRTEIEEEDVIFADGEIGWIFSIRKK